MDEYLLFEYLIFNIHFSPRGSAWIAHEAARGSSKFHNFRINDPAILIQSPYFITYFKESKSTKKKISKGAKFGEKTIFH